MKFDPIWDILVEAEHKENGRDEEKNAADNHQHQNDAEKLTIHKKIATGGARARLHKGGITLVPAN